MGQTQFLLDVSGTSDVPENYVDISSEIDFLFHALASPAVFVRGEALCRWAKEFCQGRNYEWAAVSSLAERLRLHCPTLTSEQANHIQAMLQDRKAAATITCQARDVLEALTPEGPWSDRPSPEHAARWLLWLEDKQPERSLQPLLAQIAGRWAEEGGSALAGVYTIRDGKSAHQAVASWLGVATSNGEREKWGTFPLDVPRRWQEKARLFWEAESVVGRSQLLARIQERQAPYAIRVEAAKVTSEYFQLHPTQLSQDVLATLKGLLPEEKVARMQALCPPRPPEPLPEGIDAVFDWFVHQYLPFRLWTQEYGDEASRAKALDLVAHFETWCLHFYPIALAGGLGAEHLAIQRSRQLQQSRRDCVTLWVIFDGLTYPDGQTLVRLLTEEPRLSLEFLTPTLAPLPTITQFCKRSLIEGLPSDSVDASWAVPTWEDARLLERNREASASLMEATLGDVYVWPLT